MEINPALARMNHKAMLVAEHHRDGLTADLQAWSVADPVKEAAAWEVRRQQMGADFGLVPAKNSKPFAFSQGIAIIPVSGTLINRFSGSWGGYVTGYNFVRAQMSAAVADPDVNGIVADINSYGGEAAGCFECAADIMAMRGQKPMIAVVDSNCYSAAYALAAAFDKIIVTPSGGAGSIGVVAMHISVEKLIDDMGVKVTFIHAGEHKVDGNMFQDLSKEVQRDIQKSVNASYDMFVAHVAEARGMDVKKVRNTEARVYRADEALELGLIDGIATPNAALQVFYTELTGSSDEEENAMQPTKDGQTAEAQAAAQAAQQATAVQTAEQNARVAERQRMSGIMGHEHAKGRTKLANHLAMNTSMSIEEAASVLVAAEAEKAPEQQQTQGNRFDNAMNNGQHPNVGADGGRADGQQQQNDDRAGMTDAEKILADQERFTGVKLVSNNGQPTERRRG